MGILRWIGAGIGLLVSNITGWQTTLMFFYENNFIHDSYNMYIGSGLLATLTFIVVGFTIGYLLEKK